jgi:hypothetical protein
MKNQDADGFGISFLVLIRRLLRCLLLVAAVGVVQGQTVEFRESSNPPGLFAAKSTQVQSGTTRRVSDYPLVSGAYRFAFWTVNGVRQAFPSGQAYLYPVVTVDGPVDAVANFFPVAEDGDGDRLADWWEYWMFGSRDRGPQDDDDGDGRNHEEELRTGLSARFYDDLRAGGISSRLSAPLRLLVRNRLRYTLRSEPLGLVSAEGELSPGGTYTTPYLLGDSSGFTFVGFEVDGQPVRDVTGHYLNRITVSPLADTVIVARYLPAGSDSDADGIPDAVEWQNFGNLTQGQSSDPDSDGISIAEERRQGLSLIAADRVVDGGISARLSSPLEFDRVRSRYAVQSRPLGLITSLSEMVQNGSERTSPHIGTALVSGHAFGYWSLNGVRLAGPDGLARRQVKVTVTGPSELVAHFFLPDQDTDADGLPDWWEWNLFGNLDQSSQDDPDDDGLKIADERSLGLAVATRDVMADGGIATRLSAPLQYESGSRKLLAIRSAPRGIVTDSQSYLAANSAVTSSHYAFTQLYSGYQFTHWTRNGARIKDAAGFSRNQAVFALQEDTELVAHFTMPSEDLDGDSLPDHLEYRVADELEQMNANSDLDGDGFSFAAERSQGLSVLVPDVIRDGGIASRLSAPAALQFTIPPLTLLPERLRVVNDSTGGTLVGVLSVSPAIAGKSYQFALELGEGGEDNGRFTVVGNELRLASFLNVTSRILRIRVRATDNSGVVRTWQSMVHLVSADELNEPQSYAAWTQQWADLSSKAPDADPDGDGIPNSLEYVLGGNPGQSSIAIAPQASIRDGNFIFTFQRADASETPDVSLAVETSTDLLTWPQSYIISPGTPASQVTIQENGEAPDTITVTLPGAHMRRFARLKLTLTP